MHSHSRPLLNNRQQTKKYVIGSESVRITILIGNNKIIV